MSLLIYICVCTFCVLLSTGIEIFCWPNEVKASRSSAKQSREAIRQVCGDVATAIIGAVIKVLAFAISPISLGYYIYCLMFGKTPFRGET